MFRPFWFQLHWLLGISAGAVIATMGFTGAMLSFEADLLRLMNPGVMTVAPLASGQLPPGELLARVRRAQPDARVSSLTLAADPDSAARVAFAAAPGKRRGATRYLDPYRGELLGQPRGLAFFRATREMHRWLVAGDLGKAITGGSTVGLILLCLSGLYLRWPRRALNWRAWLKVDFSRKGRGFVRNLHAVAGTLALLLYLLAGLTALYWSYDWYRAGLYSLSGTAPPLRPTRGSAAGATEQPTADVDLAWRTFIAAAGDYRTATVRLPERQGEPFSVRYLGAEPAHERAFDSMTIDAAGGVVGQARYADKPAGAKFMSSLFPLHAGSFFGLPGRLAMMTASAAMPLFLITGWMLYLGRRRRRPR